jgi:hypothetical protein
MNLPLFSKRLTAVITRRRHHEAPRFGAWSDDERSGAGMGSTSTPSCKSQVSESRSSRTPPTPTRLPRELTLTAPENSHNGLLFA